MSDELPTPVCETVEPKVAEDTRGCIWDAEKHVPHGKVSSEKMLELLEGWKEQLKKEMAEEEERREKVNVVYKRQKELYDSWLARPLNKMKKHDKIIHQKKKALVELDKEIAQRKESIIPTTTNAQQV